MDTFRRRPRVSPTRRVDRLALLMLLLGVSSAALVGGAVGAWGLGLLLRRRRLP